MSISLDRVDDTTGGAPNGGPSTQQPPEISADGRFVVFASNATDMVASDPNGNTNDVYVYDRQTGTVVNRIGGSVAGQASQGVSISGDGRYVAFESQVTDLVAGDTNNTQDVFVFDRQTGTYRRFGGNQPSENPSISADGNFVVFESLSTDLVAGDTNDNRDIFVANVQTGVIERIGAGNGAGRDASISADGRYVAFRSTVSDLVANDPNGAGSDAFLFDRQTGSIERIARNEANSDISADGRYVVFSSGGSIVVYDRDTDALTAVGGGDAPSISGDGRVVAFEIANFIRIQDLQTGAITDTPPSRDQSRPSLSQDGSDVVFISNPVLPQPNPGPGPFPEVVVADLNALNQAPSGTSGIRDVAEGNTQTFTAADFGFSDPQNSPPDAFRSVVITSLPSPNGLRLSGVAVSVDQEIPVAELGNLTYVPLTNGVGPVAVTTIGFRVRDNGGTDNGGQDIDLSPNAITFNITVANRAPVAVDDTGTTSEGATLEVTAAQGLLANDTDANLDPIRLLDFSFGGINHSAGETATVAGIGSLTIQADGSYRFVPAPNFSGQAPVVTYGVRDEPPNPADSRSDEGTLTLTVTAVNDPPTAVDDTGTTLEDTVLTRTAAQGLLANDTDPDNDPLFVSGYQVGDEAAIRAVGVTGSLGAAGTIRIDADGSYTFTPAANYTGPVPVITYTLSDGSTDRDTGTLTLSITPANDPPTAVDDSGTTLEDTVLSRTAAQGLLANDTDPDGDSLQVVAYSVTGSAVAVAPGAPLPLGGGQGSLTINADGSYVFTPGANYAGPLPTFAYVIRDAAGVESTATLTLSITPVNDAPVAVADSASTSEDTAVTVTVLANDTDVENNPLTAAIATNPANGTASVLPDGRITYTPNTGFTGTDSFTYRANDGTDNSAPATVTIAVSTRGAINGTPLADTLNGTAGRDAINGLAGNDIINALGGDDTVDGGPGADQMRGGQGNDTYIVDDFSDQVIEAPGEGTDTIRTGLAAYTMPTGSEVENLVYTGTGGFTGNGNQLANAITGGNADDSLNGLGGNDTLNGLNGNDTLSGMDGQDRLVGGIGNDTLLGGLDADTFVFDTPLNAATNVDRVSDLTSGVDRIELSGIVFAGLPTGPLAPGAFDRIGDASAATAATRIIYDPSTGAVSFDADGTGAGAAVLFARVNPGQALAAGDFTVVNGANAPVNTAPVASNDTGSGVQGNPITGNVLGNDTDAEGNPLTATLQATASNGTVLLNANGGYTYTPNASFTGTDSFSYRASDGTASSNVATVTLTVNPPGLIAGTPGNDTLNGTPGPDTIDGGAGIDTMRGAAGDDVYIVDSAADQVIELAGQGTDTIRTALASLTLATTPEVENLTYTGVQGFSGQGNAGNNVITGGVGIDVLDGAGGNDTLNGLQGNDTLLGQGGTDRLAGGIGNDTLAGGTEADTFVFDTALNATTNVDRITDFTPGSDKLELDDAVFAGLTPGALNANAFDRLGDATAATANTRIVYDPATGNLFFDADGTGGQAAVQFATLGPNLNLQAGDVNVA